MGTVMVTSRRFVRGIALALGLTAIVVAASGCQTGYILRSSVPDASTGASDPNGRSWAPSISGDGRYTVFLSTASNLVNGDTNGVVDVFVRDNATSAVTRYTNGLVDPESRPTISADGSKIAYTVNLSYPEGIRSTIAVVNRAAATVAYTRPGPIGLAEGHVRNPSLSSGGEALAYESTSTPTESPGFSATVVRVFQIGGADVIVPTTSDASPFAGNAYRPRIDPSGSWVVFDSPFSHYAPADTNGYSDVFVWQIKANPEAGTARRVSLSADGAQGNGDSAYGAWAGNGRVVFASFASNLIAGDTLGHQDVFVSQTPAAFGWGVTARIGGNDDSSLPTASVTGESITFISKASDLVPNDTNGALDVFTIRSGVATRVSATQLGAQVAGPSSWPQISYDGRWVSFESDATDLAPNDANGATDVFTGFARRISVTSMSPSLIVRNASPTVTIKGTGFKSGVNVEVARGDGGAITVSNVVVVDDTTLTATIQTTAPGGASITVNVIAGGSPMATAQGASGDCTCGNAFEFLS